MQRSGATNSGVQGVSLRTHAVAGSCLPASNGVTRVTLQVEVQVHSALPTGALFDDPTRPTLTTVLVLCIPY